MRVTITSGTRRVDLVLPGAVPVAELLPELARSVGRLDSAIVYGGYRLVTAEGRRLAGDSGLTLQGVDDGAVLTVAAGVDDAPPVVYDDVVEAMTDVVEHDLEPWDPASGRWTALAAAVLLLALGAAALLLNGDGAVAASAAGVGAVALVAGAIVLSRAQRERDAAVTVAWVAAGYAAVAALLAAPSGDMLGRPLALVGGAVALVGAVALIGLGDGRVLLLPAAVTGAVAGAVGLAVHLTSADAGVVLVAVTTLVVLAGSVFPWLALGVTATTVDQLYTPADITADPDDIDPSRVAADARLAHEILLAISTTVGILLIAVAPLAVARGLAGTLLGVVWCIVVVLRTRQYRTGTEVLIGIGAGVAGLVALAVSVLTQWPEWRPTAAGGLAAVGAVVLVSTLSPSAPSVRRGRLGDVLETVALISLLPLLAFATGLVDAVTG
ncbi:type VII secretion integral membrane protein EccD [Nocardioides sp. R-C-SC26]|uniref:type VII secretion integral membrane protein EccD n=1 Tax=Nocardioides sp. R-C-SC26 TaxID=2870414 RepID=UPI001E295236|nr:type VII secretion integral membrane protein EccD [Nocardioides sp. R-C-SC26]